MKSSTVRIGKRIMAVMLSLMMVVGVFAGMKLDTKAAGTRTIRFEDLQNGDIVHTGDIITISESQSGKNKLSLACNKPNDGVRCYNLGYGENTDGAGLSVEVRSVTHEGRTYTAFRLQSKVDNTHLALFDMIV